MSSVLYLLIIVAFGLSVWAQFKVKGTFNKWSESPAFSGMTGAEVARRILDANGLHDVPVEPVPGKLTDHYDPVARAVRL
jgi:Zn-dependent membrane protease YugP